MPGKALLLSVFLAFAFLFFVLTIKTSAIEPRIYFLDVKQQWPKSRLENMFEQRRNVCFIGKVQK